MGVQTQPMIGEGCVRSGPYKFGLLDVLVVDLWRPFLPIKVIVIPSFPDIP